MLYCIILQFIDEGITEPDESEAEGKILLHEAEVHQEAEVTIVISKFIYLCIIVNFMAKI